MIDHLTAVMLDVGAPVWACGPTAAALEGFDHYILKPPFHLVVLRDRNVRRIGHVIHSTGELPLIDRAQDESRIDKVGDLYYGAAVVRTVLRAIRDNCLQHDEVLDIPTLRDQLDTSRKFLIPLLEYVDSLGLTVLRGGVRRLLRSSDLSRELAAEGP